MIRHPAVAAPFVVRALSTPGRMRFLFVTFLGIAGGLPAGRQAAAQASPPSAASATEQASRATPAEPSNQEINDRLARQIQTRIAGHEKEPAEQVFQNIQWFKGTPAGRLLLIMNLGYSKALGVNCTHCHVEQDFASDDKRPKRAAREMAAMHRNINDQLKKMQNLEPKQNLAINCSTCHRGTIDPMSTDR